MHVLGLTISLVFGIATVVSAAPVEDALMVSAQDLFSPISATPPTMKGISQPAAKLELGKMLYFDPRLSASQLISCNTCHNLGLAGADLQETSVGHSWKKGPRNAPTVLNAVFNHSQFWDGRAKNLTDQAKGPIQAAVEMNNKPEKAIEIIRSMPGYVEKFTAAYPESAADPITFDNIAETIALFEAQLITPDAPFDRYLNGDGKALDEKERAGLSAFIDNGCTTCHNGINLGGKAFFRFGVQSKPPAEVMANDTGRFKVTGREGDKAVFRVPSLRNIALTAPYFHSGKVWDLSVASRIMGKVQLGLDLAPVDVENMTRFLVTLNGRQPEVVYPILPPSTARTPRPELL